ncbi:MAG: hypothetical protein V3U84_00310 [Thiotrichaceae bacterium]
MNIFEGSRRIVRAIQIAIGAGTALIGGFYVIVSGRFVTNDSEVVLVAIAWIIGFEIFSRVTGWVVRGFKGIPSGKDRVDDD